MSYLFALVSAAGSAASLYFYEVASKPLPSSTAIGVQIAAVLLALIAMVLYRRARTRRSYTQIGVRIFTVGFSFCFLVFIIAIGLLTAIFFGMK